MSLDIEAIRARWAAATPGPWEAVSYDDVGAAVVQRGRGELYLGRTPGGEADMDDATAIAAAPTDIANLLAEVERLRDENARLRGETNGAKDNDGEEGWLR